MWMKICEEIDVAVSKRFTYTNGSFTETTNTWPASLRLGELA